MRMAFPLSLMEHSEIQAKCEQFLKELNVSSFIVFGWKKNEEEFGVVSSFHEMPSHAAIKAMSWALNDYITRSL